MYQSFNLLEALTALENVWLVSTQRALNWATAANLDTERRRKVMETNNAVEIFSHDHHIRDIADRVMQMEDGRLQAES